MAQESTSSSQKGAGGQPIVSKLRSDSKNRHSNSLDIIASTQDGVELTKFNTLNARDRSPTSQERTKLDQKTSKLTSPLNLQLNVTKSVSAGNLVSVANVTNALSSASKHQTSIELPWVSEAGGNKSKFSSEIFQIGGQEMLQQEQEQFLVVWSRLSFEVKLTAYDQLVSRSFKKLASIIEWNSTSSSECKELSELRPKGQKQVIFENLNGYFKSSEITAILGPSGAGKTSLLNAICGRTEGYRGSVQLIGGGKRRMRMSIIPQKDYLEESLTVRENLLYSSKILNVDKSFDHESNILRVVKMLNLNHCFNSRASSISGGEYKRVSIAQELLRQPDIMILDEPTSGLDSLNCKNLIRSLNELIEASKLGKIQPIAIVMTIHQPDIDIFRMFNHVYCMARGGRVIFDGQPTEVLDVMRTQAGFTEADMPPELEANPKISANPANVLIEIASEHTYGSAPVDQLAAFNLRQFEHSIHNLLDSFNKYSPSPTSGSQFSSGRGSSSSIKFFGLPDVLIPAGNKEDNKIHKGSLISLTNHSHYSPEASLANGLDSSRKSKLVRDKRLAARVDHGGHFWHHTWILTKRTFVSTMRDPFATFVSLIFHMSIPFVMGLVYGDRIGKVRGCPMVQRSMDIVSLISNETISKMAELQDDITTSYECGTMFFITSYSFSMCAISIAALFFPMSMHILLKEYRNGWYRLPSFLIARTLAGLPLELLLPTISTVTLYHILDMPSSYLGWRLTLLILVFGLTTMVSTTHGLICGALFMNSVQTAIFISIASTLPLNLLSGYTARITKMPMILRYSSWLSVYRYTTDSINIIRFGYGMCPCDASTEDYLMNSKPRLLGIPNQLAPMMTYYLVNNADSSNETTTVPYLINDTLIEVPHNTSSSSISTAITGISRDLILDQDSRTALMSRLESNDVDLFGQLASILSKAFTYGRDIDRCSAMRSQILASIDAPPDEVLPFLIGGLACLVVITKLILFFVLKQRVGAIV